ncbi:MAG TPA: SDR family NAD(P)-dependent oxidoreductase, partial [Spirochaetota bacterium]
MELTGNTIVITGGSSGIGLALAKILSQKNKVIICGRSMTRLTEAVDQIPGISVFQCDLSQQSECEKLYDWVKRNHPDCNILINNAAIVHNTNFFDDGNIIEKSNAEIRTNI